MNGKRFEFYFYGMHTNLSGLSGTMSLSDIVYIFNLNIYICSILDSDVLFACRLRLSMLCAVCCARWHCTRFCLHSIATKLRAI